MQAYFDKLKILFFLAVMILVGVGVHTAIDGNRSAYNPIMSAAIVSIVWLSPLIVVAFAILSSKIKYQVIVSSLFALIVGGFFEFGYYSYSDPSYGMLIVFSIIANWVAGIFAVVSFSHKR